MSDEVENDVNERLTGVETNVSHIFVTIGEMKADNREFRNEARGEARDLRNELAKVNTRIDGLGDRVERLRVDIAMTKVWMLGMLLGVLATLLSVMARGFHWI
jgi:hypothetical protein